MGNEVVVQESCRTIRALARNALRGKWGLAALATFVWLLATCVPTYILSSVFENERTIFGVSDFYTLLVEGALTLGYANFCLSIFRQQTASVAQIFSGFERFVKTLGLYLVMNIFIILWTFLFIIPGIVAVYRYSLSFYLLADDPEIGILEALGESSRLMKGNKWKMFVLELSITGWCLLLLITLLIVLLSMSLNPLLPLALYGVVLLAIVSLIVIMFWLLPYVETARIALYELARGSLRADNMPEITREPPRY